MPKLPLRSRYDEEFIEINTIDWLAIRLRKEFTELSRGRRLNRLVEGVNETNLAADKAPVINSHHKCTEEYDILSIKFEGCGCNNPLSKIQPCRQGSKR